MKQLTCNRCSKLIGEIELGKFRKDGVVLCKECHGFFITCESLYNYSRASKGASSGAGLGFEDLFKGIMGDKK